MATLWRHHSLYLHHDARAAAPFSPGSSPGRPAHDQPQL